MKGKKNKKRILKNLGKRILMFALSALIVFSSVFTNYEITVSATENSLWDNILISIVRDGSYATGAVIGGAIGSAISPGAGTIAGSVIGGNVAGGAVNAVLDWYENSSEMGSVSTVTDGSGGGGRKINYQYRKGVSTSQNTTNYNTTKNMSIYNETKTWNSTTNNYDYSYNWYNPITNTYNTTNEYTYNATYNTYNYVTYDVTNNYTTNYYIQDNRTYVSYYIINVNNETQEEEETYVEMYYELPDGRNSLYLTVDDIKGQYFPSNYSKYISVAEDDGTTLGLWHLDGDLKDSSYWGNTAGAAYNNVYTDGLYTNGKQFSDSDEDFLELKLDKVDLPETWTLEWCEYLPNVGIESIETGYGSGLSSTGGNFDYNSISDQASRKILSSVSDSGKTEYYFDSSAFDIYYDVDLIGYLGVDSDCVYQGSSKSFIPYALVYDGSNYKFYRNGVLLDSKQSLGFTIPQHRSSSNAINIDLEQPEMSEIGLKVDSESIKFYNDTTVISHRIEDEYILGQETTYTKYFTHAELKLCLNAHKNSIIDEVRLSSGVLYSGSAYTPSSQAFTTNTVLAVPGNPQKHEIAFKTNTDISEVRFGGARPTYPTNGYVYVALDADDKVESVQQYQEDGWYEIEASIYLSETWVSFSGFEMEYLGIDGVGDDSGDDSGDAGGDTGDTGDTGGDSDSDSSGGGVQAILDGIGKFFDTLLNLVGKIIGLFSGFVDSVLSLFEGFTVFTDGFSGFLSATFGFLPPEAINVLISGITLIVILAIIKFLK